MIPKEKYHQDKTNQQKKTKKIIEIPNQTIKTESVIL